MIYKHYLMRFHFFWCVIEVQLILGSLIIVELE